MVFSARVILINFVPVFVRISPESLFVAVAVHIVASHLRLVGNDGQGPQWYHGFFPLTGHNHSQKMIKMPFQPKTVQNFICLVTTAYCNT